MKQSLGEKKIARIASFLGIDRRDITSALVRGGWPVGYSLVTLETTGGKLSMWVNIKTGERHIFDDNIDELDKLIERFTPHPLTIEQEELVKKDVEEFYAPPV